MYSRDEVKALTDRVLNMAKADALEVSVEGGERSATRWANSSITVNLVQYDQQLTLNLRRGLKQGTASTREFDDESLKAMVDEAQDAAQKARDNPNLTPLVKGPQEYVTVDAVMPKTADFGPGERGGGGGGGFNFGGIGRPFVKADGTPKIGQKLFSDSFTLKSDIGNPILRQTPVMNDGSAAQPVTWIEKGVLKNVYYDPATARRQKVAPSPANPNMSLVVDGTTQSIEDMVKTTKRGLLVTFFWYLRPVDTLTLLNTGMTRDGLFLIENGEIAGPVQNFRWNMSPPVPFAMLSAVGKAWPDASCEAS